MPNYHDRCWTSSSTSRGRAADRGAATGADGVGARRESGGAGTCTTAGDAGARWQLVLPARRTVVELARGNRRFVVPSAACSSWYSVSPNFGFRHRLAVSQHVREIPHSNTKKLMRLVLFRHKVSHQQGNPFRSRRSSCQGSERQRKRGSQVSSWHTKGFATSHRLRQRI